MSLTWRLLILACTSGVAAACMTSQICAGYQNKAMNELMANNMTGYCRLQSKALACYSGDTDGCPESSVLQPLYNGYYNTCSLAADDVANCTSEITASCGQLRIAVLTSSNSSEYCRNMDTYMSCIIANMTECSNKVTIYDVLGLDFATYDKVCSGSLNRTVKLQQCQMLIYSSCFPLLSNITYKQGDEYCRTLTGYLDCVNKTMENCDSSLQEAEVIGQMRPSFHYQCGTGSCPAITTCMQSVASTTPPGNEGEQPASGGLSTNLLQQCGNMGDMMTCMDREFASCNMTKQHPYTFTDLANLYTKACRVLANNTAMLTCPEMTTCMSTLPIPTDPAEIMKLYYDPEFWCSVLRMAMRCAVNTSDTCEGDTAVINMILTETVQLCFEDPLIETTQTTTNAPTTKQESVDPVNTGTSISMNSGTVVCLFSLMLLT